jgi:NAD(P)H-flavin reductase
MPESYPARVVTRIPAAEAQVLLTFEVPREVWSAHREPGQYVELAVGDMRPWHGTIANRPGRETFDFLVKDVGERSHIISGLEPGDDIGLSVPKGPGFPLNANRKCDILIACCGVAICAMRSVVEEILLARNDWGRVHLFYGERTADRFALMEEQELWRENRIEIFLSASRPAEGTYWRGHVGYVQDHLHEVRPDLKNAVAFLAGKDAMVSDFTAALTFMGMLPSRIFLNI